MKDEYEFIVYNKFVHKYGRLPTEFDPDYLEMLAMGKYRILAVPDQQPGKCANCGSSKSDGRLYIDFGLLVDFYGTVFLCDLCLTDLARKLGIFKSLEDKLKEALKIQEDLAFLKKQGTEVEETVLHTFEEVKKYFAGLHSVRDDSSPDSDTSLGSGEKPSEPILNQTKSGSDKSTSGRRSQGLPDFTNILGSTS